MTKEKFIEELGNFKTRCKELESEFKPLAKKFKELKKVATKLRKEMDANSKLYVTETLSDDSGKCRNWTHSDGWDDGLHFRCTDIEDYLPDAIETIDNVLHNVNAR